MPQPQTVLYAKDFTGYIPVVDPRRMNKPVIINGSNFLFDIDGPRSAFGTQYANYVKYDDTTKIKPVELRVGDDIWYGTPTGVYRHDPITGQAILMINVTITQPFWPWSVALCGGKYYFAQNGVGLWQYDPLTYSITKITTPVADANVKFVSVSYGRLIVLFSNTVADAYMWSALDDGTDFVPSLTTSAGAQTCGIVGRTGYRIDAVADGFIVSCSTGIIKATYVGGNFIWQHRTLSKEIKIFSPNCGTVIPDVGVLLIDRNGMYLTNGEIPQPWEPLMGQYFKDNQLEPLNASFPGCLNIYYSIAMQAIFVSFAPTAHQGDFNVAFVYLTISQKWGIFNKAAWGFFDVILPLTGVEYCAYMSYDGYMQYFVETHQSDAAPLAPYSFDEVVWRPASEQAVLTVNNVQQGYTLMKSTDFMPEYYNSLVQLGTYYFAENVLNTEAVPNYTDAAPVTSAGVVSATVNLYFYPDGGVPLVPSTYQLPKVGLNSFVEVGPFRFTEQLAADETSMISSLIVGISPVVAFAIFEDWNVLIGSEDWSLEDGYEDWGAGSGLPDTFTLTLTTTNDGTNVGAQGAEILYAVNNMGGSLMYSPQGWSGIYHRFKLQAANAGEGFSLKYLDIAGELTGRMTING